MSKSADAFRTIREVADWLGVPTHVLRFWESKFDQVKPVKGPGGRRYYRPDDMRLLGGIRVLLHEQGMTIRGVQKKIKEGGVSEIEAMSPEPSFEDVATPRMRRRPARSVAVDANAGGTGQGGLYDLDALADGIKDPDEAPMVHVDTPEHEAEVVAFREALSEQDSPASEPPFVAPSPVMETPEPEVAPPTPTPAAVNPAPAAPKPAPVEPTTPDMFDPAPKDAIEDDKDPESPAPEPAPDGPLVLEGAIMAEPGRDSPRPVDELPEVAPNDPSLQPEHVAARAMTDKVRAARSAGHTLNVTQRARLGIVTRRLRTLALRLTQEVQD